MNLKSCQAARSNGHLLVRCPVQDNLIDNRAQLPQSNSIKLKQTHANSSKLKQQSTPKTKPPGKPGGFV
jgi:hypothetical protein